LNNFTQTDFNTGSWYESGWLDEEGETSARNLQREKLGALAAWIYKVAANVQVWKMLLDVLHLLPHLLNQHLQFHRRLCRLAPNRF
jgi:hypothetical protein